MRSSYTPPPPPTAADAPPTREEAYRLFSKWINQRPGLDPHDYGHGREGWNNYRSEGNRVSRQRGPAAIALEHFASLPYDALTLARAFRFSYSGRLSYNPATQELKYTTGQYWPTEYRPAAAAVLESYIRARTDQLSAAEAEAASIARTNAFIVRHFGEAPHADA